MCENKEFISTIDYLQSTGLIVEDSELVLLSKVNEFFFGTNNFSKNLNYFVLANNNIITKNGSTPYLVYAKLIEYLDYVVKYFLSLDYKFDLCPYNYYKYIETFFEKVKIPKHYQKLISTIDNFLTYLDKTNTPDSMKIRNILTPCAHPGELNKLECRVVGVLHLDTNIELESSKDFTIILKLTGCSDNLFIKLSTENNPDTLLLTKSYVENNYAELCEFINGELLKNSPENFMIQNVEKICGSREFAEIMVKSYLDKNKFVFTIDSINSVVQWKSNATKNKYNEYFIKRYENCVRQSESHIYLNFEGINKFLLNINESDVENWEVKEQINTMYYNSMYQMLNSIEQLYKK